MRRGGYDGNGEMIEGLATASSIRAILAPVQSTPGPLPPTGPQTAVRGYRQQDLSPTGVTASPLISVASPLHQEAHESVNGMPSRPPSRPIDVAALSSGTAPSNYASHVGYASLRSPEVSVRTAAPRYARGADPPPLANSSSFLAQASTAGSQAHMKNIQISGLSTSGGAVSSASSMPVRPASVVPTASSSTVGRLTGPRVSGGGMSAIEADSVGSRAFSDAQSFGEQSTNLTPSLGSGRPRNVQARVFPGQATSQAIKPVVKASVLSVSASGAPGPLLSSSRSLVPPPARVSSSLVPSASRYFSYAPAVVRNPDAFIGKPASFTPSLTRAAADTANVHGSSNDERPVAPVKFLEGLHRPMTSPLLAESKAQSSRVGEDKLASSVRHSSAHQHQKINIEGLSSGHGTHPAVWAYPSKSATTAQVISRDGPPELGDYRRPDSNYAEFVHDWPDAQAESSSQDVPFEERFPMFFGGRELPMPFTAVGAVPNRSPPVMRYTVNPKDGCLETSLDTQQPAHVPDFAAAAMAAVTAASGKNALFPNFAEREKERIEGDSQQQSGLQCSSLQVEEDEFEQQLKAELEAARTKRAEAVKRLMHPSNN
mmetsp:Transcript_89663/g.141561  ORF Transcript_89663/g.141561 Transcript_89663/m.141561 type:complete len:600 (+) Transcript_89663:199-1998(+)